MNSNETKKHISVFKESFFVGLAGITFGLIRGLLVGHPGEGAILGGALGAIGGVTSATINNLPNV